MDRCASCGRELASTWKFCVYCGRPFVAADRQPKSVSSESSGERRGLAQRKYDAVFWVGVGVGVIGLALIVFMAVQIYSIRT